MKFNEEWLGEWVAFDCPLEELGRVLTMAGLEVDSITPAGTRADGVVVGEVLAVNAHPHADRLSVCTVGHGQGAPVQIVCGAPNVRAGMKVALAAPGAVLPGGTRIEQTTIRGERSHGMLCSAAELGLGDDGSGILELPGDAAPGLAIAECLRLDDRVVDIDLTPNRGDCLCITGIAREVGALLRRPARPVEVVPVAPAIDDALAIVLDAPEGCPRYAGRVIRDVDTTAPVPLWMTERLRRCGVRSISAVVDVTNYVMLELGQPMHAFDLDRLRGGIRVRYARGGETLELLDGQQITLNGETLVIADQERPVALAGVMGGAGTAVESHTRNIFLESAYFDPVRLAGAARHFRLHTDASHRFERGVDYTGQRRAIERATRLLLDICGGTPGPVEVADAPGHLPRAVTIEFRPARVARVLGFTLPDSAIIDIFERLGLTVEPRDGLLCVTPPNARSDLVLEADLMEEVARIYGYDRIEPRTPHVQMSIGAADSVGGRGERARQAMVAQGYFEAITYSFIDPGNFSRVSPALEPRLLANPISSDMSAMRASLWPGLLEAAKYNQNRRHRDVRLFELGMVFEQTAGGVDQHDRLGAIAVGDAVPEQWGAARRRVDYFDLKHDLEAALAGLGGYDCRTPAAHHDALHPGQCGEIIIEDKTVGYIGTLHPRLVRHWGFETAPVLFELDLARLPRERSPSFRPLSRFPSVRRDISLVVAADIPAEDVLERARMAGGGLLKDLQLFDVYRGQGIDSDKKSLAIGLIFQADSSTLTDDVVEKAVNSVLDQLRRDVGGTIRE